MELGLKAITHLVDGVLGPRKSSVAFAGLLTVGFWVRLLRCRGGELMLMILVGGVYKLFDHAVVFGKYWE